MVATPREAWIEVDGQRLAERTPVTLEDLPAGRVQLTLGAAEHRPLTVAVDIPRDGLARLEPALEPIPFGSLTLDLEPADATVTLADAELRYRPGVRLPQGAHRVVVSRDGYSDVTRTIDVSGDTRVRVALEPERQAGDSREFDGIEFVWIPAGEFRMGSTSTETESHEQPITQVRISRGFWMGRYEVTQEQWEAVMGSNPSEFKICGPDCPVENVSWEDAQEFIRRLNEPESGTGFEFRLPTEAEWEYAARTRTSGDRYGDLDTIGWHGGNSGRRPHPVGQKAPNAWGLYDPVGNVWEWVQDWYGDYPGGSLTDPTGRSSGMTRMRRGGGWDSSAQHSRSTARRPNPPSRRQFNNGIRLVRTE